MDHIQIKSYLASKEQASGYEIRRCELQLQPTGSFGVLVARLVDLYSGLIGEGDELKVCWLDDESEQVGFRSDAELEHAVNYQRKRKRKRICSPFSFASPDLTLKVYVLTRAAPVPTKKTSTADRER